MIYTRPLRRTSWLSRCRVRRDFKELRTFIGPSKKTTGHPAGQENETYALSAASDQPQNNLEATSGGNFEVARPWRERGRFAAFLQPDLRAQKERRFVPKGS